MTPDLGLALLRRGYRAIPELTPPVDQSSACPVRLLGRPAAVVRGPAAVRLFYDEDAVQRTGAVPAVLAGLLFGRGAVHGTDGATHRSRKQMFLDLLADDRTTSLAAAVGADLQRRVTGWAGRSDVVVFDELVAVYGTAVLAWAGLGAAEPDPVARSRQLAAIVDGFGGAPLAYPRAWAARLAADRWAARLVRRARSGALSPPAGSALQVVATGAGADLDPRTAGVELLNVLRPTVAVAWPATFAAVRLLEHPELRPQLAGDDEDAAARRIAFEHEVRRTAPFVPALAARTRRPLHAGDVPLAAGRRVVLDVPGTNHDPRTWSDPERFDPERMLHREPDAFEYVPQGGGDPRHGHRCPGEPLTARILAETIRVLAGVDYRPRAPLGHDLTRIPTLPRGGLPVSVPRSG